jgi:hypothetical protein
MAVASGWILLEHGGAGGIEIGIDDLIEYDPVP